MTSFSSHKLNKINPLCSLSPTTETIHDLTTKRRPVQEHYTCWGNPVGSLQSFVAGYGLEVSTYPEDRVTGQIGTRCFPVLKKMLRWFQYHDTTAYFSYRPLELSSSKLNPLLRRSTNSSSRVARQTSGVPRTRIFRVSASYLYTFSKTAWPGDRSVTGLYLQKITQTEKKKSRYPCPQWDSNPWPQSSKGRRQSTVTTRSLRSASLQAAFPNYANTKQLWNQNSPGLVYNDSENLLPNVN